MKRMVMTTLIIMSVLACVPLHAQDANEPATFEAKYQLILDRNIFSKDRTVM